MKLKTKLIELKKLSVEADALAEKSCIPKKQKNLAFLKRGTWNESHEQNHIDLWILLMCVDSPLH